MNTITFMEVTGIECCLIENGTNGPVFIWPMYPHCGNEIEHMKECIQETLPDSDYVVAAFQVSDWNADLSPWKSDMAFMDRGFIGNGPNTLKWVIEEYIPFLRGRYGDDSKFIPMGYSLAGLFTLWSIYQTDLFAGAISCSSSLWFEGWDEYIRLHGVESIGYVYISLGGKEEKVKDPIVATVGIKHRQQEKILKADKNVQDCIYVQNPGGHFADSAKRMVKGVSWMIAKLAEN